MTHEDRLRGVIFLGMTDFQGAFPPYGCFNDPVTGSTFTVKVNEPIGPALDKVVERFDDYEKLGDTLDDPQAIADLIDDIKYQDSKER